MKHVYVLLTMLVAVGCATESKTSKAPLPDPQQVFFERCGESLGKDYRCSVQSSASASGSSRTYMFGREVGGDGMWVCSQARGYESNAAITMPTGVEFEGFWPKGHPATLGDFRCAYLVCNEKVCQESGDETALAILRQSAPALEKKPATGPVTREDLHRCLEGPADQLTTMACAEIAYLPKDKVTRYFAKGEIAKAKNLFAKYSQQINKQVMDQCLGLKPQAKEMTPHKLPEKPVQLELESIRCEGGFLTIEAKAINEQIAQKKAGSTLLIHPKEKTFKQVLRLPFVASEPSAFHDIYSIEKRLKNGFYFMTAKSDEWATSAYNLPLCLGYQQKGDEVLVSHLGNALTSGCSNGGVAVWKYKIANEKANKQK